MILLGAATMRLRRRAASEAALETTLALERSTSAFALARADSKVDEEQRARRLVADATDALVLEIDKDGIVRSCSAAVEQLLGYTAAELVGHEVYSLLHPDDLLSPANGPQRYARKDGSYVVLEGRRLTRRDELGFVAGVVTVLRGTASASTRTAEQRIQAAVALEPDPIELFSIVAKEAALDLHVDAAAVVRFETGGFGTIVGACEPRGLVELIPGTTVSLESDEPAALVFRTGQPATGAAPIRIGARLWGALVAQSADSDRLAALALAAQPAVAFADATARLGALATRDQLTNLPDHRAFHEQLRSEARRAERHERALSLVLINIDDFKRINTVHGRLAGDRALAEVGRRLAATVRNGELVSRLSADHFGWILPETEGLNGWVAAERARRALAAAPIEGVGSITASAGVCDFEEVGGSDELLALAEVALVHAKGSGGNATFRYSAELDGGGTGHEREDDRGLGRLRALACELDAEDPGTEGHSERVSRLAEKLALSCGWSSDRAIRLAQAALLHDVGKLGIDEDVLRKPGPLTRVGARADTEPSRHGRRDRRQGTRRGAARLDPPPPRALGRRRLSAWRRRRSDSRRCTPARARGSLGLDDVQPCLRRRARHRRCTQRVQARTRGAVRTRGCRRARAAVGTRCSHDGRPRRRRLGLAHGLEAAERCERDLARELVGRTDSPRHDARDEDAAVERNDAVVMAGARQPPRFVHHDRP